MLDLRTVFGKKEFLIFQLEISHLFSHSRIWHFIPLLIFGVFFVAGIYPDASPFIPIIIVVFCGLELQYDNLFFRTSKEFEAYLMFPVSWKKVILMKNLATILLTLIIFGLTSMSLLYFSPATITLTDLKDVMLYLLTVIFPLIQFGNSQSVRNPRRISGFQINDFIEAVWMLVNVAILSMPYYLFTKLFEMPWLCIVYAAVTIAVWWVFSINKTAEYIKKNRFELCNK